MSTTGGWGIPFLGCISLSSGLWTLIILGGVQAIHALKPPQESKIVSNMDQPWLQQSLVLPELKQSGDCLKISFRAKHTVNVRTIGRPNVCTTPEEFNDLVASSVVNSHMPRKH